MVCYRIFDVSKNSPIKKKFIEYDEIQLVNFCDINPLFKPLYDKYTDSTEKEEMVFFSPSLLEKEIPSLLENLDNIQKDINESITELYTIKKNVVELNSKIEKKKQTKRKIIIQANVDELDSNIENKKQPKRKIIIQKDKIRLSGMKYYCKSRTQHLKKWCNDNWKKPYPKQHDIDNFVKITSLGQVQIKNWFCNFRMRFWKTIDKFDL